MIYFHLLLFRVLFFITRVFVEQLFCPAKNENLTSNLTDQPLSNIHVGQPRMKTLSERPRHAISSSHKCLVILPTLHCLVKCVPVWSSPLPCWNMLVLAPIGPLVSCLSVVPVASNSASQNCGPGIDSPNATF